MEVRSTVTVNRPASELYDFWRDFENLPRFMHHLEHVETMGPRSHWVAKAPANRTVEWDAEIVEDVPNERIAWRSLEGSRISNAGVVRFVAAPGNRGTEIHVELSYDPPAGAAGALIAKFFGEEPHQQVRDDLRRFKQVMETGEVLRSDGSPEGIGSSIIRQHPAQPSENEAHL
jgi:Predicted integral membrane protein